MSRYRTFLSIVLAIFLTPLFAQNTDWHNGNGNRKSLRKKIHDGSQRLQELSRELELLSWRLAEADGDVDDVHNKLQTLIREATLMDQEVRRLKQRGDRRPIEIPSKVEFSDTGRVSSQQVTVYPQTRRAYPLREIFIKNTGGRSRYIRISDVTIVDADGKKWTTRELVGHGLYEKVYPGSTFRLRLRQPIAVKKLTMNVHHDSNNLQVWGTPASKGYIYHND